ncbi:MAG TPA: S1C family serine protease [Gammaproteobacteria bacterium]|nr:S1C family serine protease [Gammaproteobacteria bacterium]
MPLRRSSFALLLLACLRGAQAAGTTAPEFVFERAAPSVVTVYAADRGGRVLSQGSGVVVQARHVLTNCHVLKGADFVGLKSGGATITAELVEVKIAHDLCLLRAALLDAPPLARGSAQDLRIGQRVYALGAPLGLDLTFTEGLVSGLRHEGGYALIQTSAAVSPGSSGGALLAQDGSLVGIISFKLSDEGNHRENLNFAMPIDLLDEFGTLPR